MAAVASVCDDPPPPGGYEATLVTGSGDDLNLEKRALFLANLSGESAKLLDGEQVNTLFGPPPATDEPSPQGPMGFWKPFFMSGADPPPPGSGGFTYNNQCGLVD